jgi:hypothetical protein
VAAVDDRDRKILGLTKEIQLLQRRETALEREVTERKKIGFEVAKKNHELLIRLKATLEENAQLRHQLESVRAVLSGLGTTMFGRMQGAINKLREVVGLPVAPQKDTPEIDGPKP